MLEENNDLTDLSANLPYVLDDGTAFSKYVDFWIKCSLGRCVPKVFKMYGLAAKDLSSPQAIEVADESILSCLAILSNHQEQLRKSQALVQAKQDADKNNPAGAAGADNA